MKMIVSILLCLVLSFSQLFTQPVQMQSRLYGVTIDDINNLGQIITSLKELPRKPTVRIAFNPQKPASYYTDAVDSIHNVSFVMGELLDSYYMKDYSVQQYEERTRNYIDTFGTSVDIWEIGNEVNGEWLGDTYSVSQKIKSAFQIVNSLGKLSALTFYYNKDCAAKPENEMFRWALDNIPENMRDSLSYVFVSYYEDDCFGLQPDWQTVFDSLRVLFPNSMLGIGECGTKLSGRKKEYMKRYYSMEISTPNFVGGYFWWFYKEDCVPYTKPLWKTLNSIFRR